MLLCQMSLAVTRYRNLSAWLWPYFESQPSQPVIYGNTHHDSLVDSQLMVYYRTRTAAIFAERCKPPGRKGNRWEQRSNGVRSNSLLPYWNDHSGMGLGVWGTQVMDNPKTWINHDVFWSVLRLSRINGDRWTFGYPRTPAASWCPWHA